MQNRIFVFASYEITAAERKDMAYKN